LPIIETQAGDNSAYIPTNVISITDGQIFLLTDLFNAGQRPSIDSGQSVSRVGGAAQIGAMKQVARALKIELANYRELQSFAQFGSDLDVNTRKVLSHGAILMELLRQNQYEPKSVDNQIIELFAVQNKFLEEIPIPEIKGLLRAFYDHVRVKHAFIIEEIHNVKKLSEKSLAALKDIARAFFASEGK